MAFTDDEGIGGYGEWDTVPASIVTEIAYRTPGFSGWQQERWWTHCGDGAAFLGRGGYAELSRIGPEALAAIRTDTGIVDDEEWASFARALSREGSPTAYVFRCRHCGKLGGYQDCD